MAKKEKKEKVRYYDSVECDFKKGTNLIEVKVMHTMDFFTTVYKTVVPMLVMEATAGDDTVITDDSWSCRYLGEYELIRHDMRSLPPFEIVTKGKDDFYLPIERGDRCIFKEDGHFISGGAAFNFLLEKRPIPMIYPEKEITLSPIKRGNSFVEYDAGEYMTAKVRLNIHKNSNVKIIAADCSKFHRIAFSKISDISTADYIVTNTDIPKDMKDEIVDHGITLA